MVKENQRRHGGKAGATRKKCPACLGMQPCFAFKQQIISIDFEWNRADIVQHGGNADLGQRQAVAQGIGNPGHTEMVPGQLRFDQIQRAGNPNQQFKGGNVHKGLLICWPCKVSGFHE